MVVPIREVVNKHPFTLAFNLIPSQMAMIPASKAIDIDNYNDIREDQLLLVKEAPEVLQSLQISHPFHIIRKWKSIITSQMRSLQNLLIVPSYYTKTIVEKVFLSVRQLTIVLLETYNIFQTRLQL